MLLAHRKSPDKPSIERALVGTLWSGTTVVPADFLGITTASWPEAREGAANISPAPQFLYGLWRCHDYAPQYNFGVFWRGLHHGPGDFSSGTKAAAWASLDVAMDTHRLAGHSVAYSIYGCPTFDVQAAFASSSDNYGGLGGGSPPNTIGTRGAHNDVYVHLFDFVVQLVTRYNTESVRSNAGQKVIKYLETWNEPLFQGYSTGAFFYGTAVECARMARTVKLAARSVDPTIMLVGPGFTGGPSYITPFLNASDGSGGFGRDHVDAINYHPYAVIAPGVDRPSNSPSNIVALTAQIRAAIVAGGLPSTTPIYAYEQAPSSSVDGTAWPWHWAPEKHASYIRRVSTLMAALGWKSVVWYHYDRQLLGNATKHRIIADALHAVHTQVAGRTLQQIDLRDDGSYRVTHSGGTFFV